MKPDPGRRTRVTIELGTEADPVVVRWCTRRVLHLDDPQLPVRPGTVGVFDSYALHTPDGWVLVDPEQPTATAAARLWALIGPRPVATLLTNDWHERDAYAFRAARGAPVWAAAAGLPERGGELEGRPDHAFEDGATLPGGVRALRVDGLRAGDTAFHWRAPTGACVLLTGDAINGPADPALTRPDHSRRAPRLYFGGRPTYLGRHPQPARFLGSVRRLLDEEIDLLCAGHSLPWRDDPRGALARLIDAPRGRRGRRDPLKDPDPPPPTCRGRRDRRPLQVRRSPLRGYPPAPHGGTNLGAVLISRHSESVPRGAVRLPLGHRTGPSNRSHRSG